MSDKNLEQRMNIKCLRARETVALRRNRFKEKQENVQDGPKSGQPKTQRTDANVDRVRSLVRSVRRLSVRQTAEELNSNKETVKKTKN
jgi:hypothetical protein